MTLRLLSLNTGGGRLHGPLIDYIGASGADILCLQEVVRTPRTRSEWLDYRDGGLVLPQRANLFEEIAAVLPGHDGRFLPAASGILHDERGRAVPSRFGLATFLRRDLAIVSDAAQFVHGAYSPDGWGEHPRARNAHAFRFFDPGIGPVTVAHMHGLRDPAGKHDTDSRSRQAAAFSGLIRRIAQPGDRIVACGDFNILPGSATFDLLAGLGLTDLVTTRGFTDTRTSHYAKPGRHADYLLTSRELRILDFDVVREPEVPDHRALVLDFA